MLNIHYIGCKHRDGLGQTKCSRTSHYGHPINTDLLSFICSDEKLIYFRKFSKINPLNMDIG